MADVRSAEQITVVVGDLTATIKPLVNNDCLLVGLRKKVPLEIFMTGTGGIVEVQGTAETTPFTQERFDQLMVLAKKGIGELTQLQKLTVG